MTQALSKLNFRDIGGLPTADGGRLRAGMLYRSEGPANFLAEHRRELQELGIKLICDLRSNGERRRAPNDWTETARMLNIELTADLRVKSNDGWNTLRHDPSEAGARLAMKTNYAAIPNVLHPYLAELIGAIIGGETPILLHCTAGKDRTGVAIGILLTMFGVPHEEIVADYLRSDIFGRNLRLAGPITETFKKAFGFLQSEAAIDTMLGVDPQFLDAAFDVIIAQWGSIDAYLDTAGVDAGKREQCRAIMIV